MKKEHDSESNVYTTQRTFKTFKAQKVISLLLIVVGFILTMVAESPEDPIGPTGAFMILAGGIWYLINRIRIWWNHA